MEIDLKQLRELMRSLKQFDITELEIEKDGERVRLRRGPESSTVMQPIISGSIAAPAPAQSGSIPPPPPLPAELSAKAAAAVDPNVVTITSPFVGTFYRAASPDQPPFVDVGTEIKLGQTLCIVEAMKLMNEIEAEMTGTIVEVAAQNGKPVEYGDVLFRVRKSG